jgi:hypothetical protein
MNWAWLWFVGMAVAVSGVYAFGRRSSGRLLPEALIGVSWTEDEITATYPTGERMSVRWDCLTRVAIRTTSDGPFSPDVFWGLHAGSDKPAVVFSGGATGETELLAELQRRLPGFDNAAVINAMSSTSDRYFVAWQRAA